MTTGTDFVFLHGGGQGSWVWDETLAALALQTNGSFGRALALDAPGCGLKRGRDTSQMDMAEVLDDLLGDIDRSGMKDTVLVGHSHAGSVLPMLVGARPELFRRLVYVSCNAPAPGQTVLELMGKGVHGENENEVGWPEPFDGGGSVSRQYPKMFCNDMSEAEATAFLAKLGPDMWPPSTTLYRDYRYDHLGVVPATYVICLKDGILPVAWQERFADRHKVERRVYIDAGHQAMITRPHGLAEILLHEAAL